MTNFTTNQSKSTRQARMEFLYNVGADEDGDYRIYDVGGEDDESNEVDEGGGDGGGDGDIPTNRRITAVNM